MFELVFTFGFNRLLPHILIVFSFFSQLFIANCVDPVYGWMVNVETHLNFLTIFKLHFKFDFILRHKRFQFCIHLKFLWKIYFAYFSFAFNLLIWAFNFATWRPTTVIHGFMRLQFPCAKNTWMCWLPFTWG